jgi:hypothetical protein
MSSNSRHPDSSGSPRYRPRSRKHQLDQMLPAARSRAAPQGLWRQGGGLRRGCPPANARDAGAGPRLGVPSSCARCVGCLLPNTRRRDQGHHLVEFLAVSPPAPGDPASKGDSDMKWGEIHSVTLSARYRTPGALCEKKKIREMQFGYFTLRANR